MPGCRRLESSSVALHLSDAGHSIEIENPELMKNVTVNKTMKKN